MALQQNCCKNLKSPMCKYNDQLCIFISSMTESILVQIVCVCMHTCLCVCLCVCMCKCTFMYVWGCVYRSRFALTNVLSFLMHVTWLYQFIEENYIWWYKHIAVMLEVIYCGVDQCIQYYLENFIWIVFHSWYMCWSLQYWPITLL